MANNQADNSRLYIFCDGAKAQTSTEEIKAVVETRKVVREKNGVRKYSSSNRKRIKELPVLS